MGGVLFGPDCAVIGRGGAESKDLRLAKYQIVQVGRDRLDMVGYPGTEERGKVRSELLYVVKAGGHTQTRNMGMEEAFLAPSAGEFFKLEETVGEASRQDWQRLVSIML